MYGETFYGRHTAQHQLQWSQIKIRKATYIGRSEIYDNCQHLFSIFSVELNCTFVTKTMCYTFCWTSLYHVCVIFSLRQVYASDKQLNLDVFRKFDYLHKLPTVPPLTPFLSKYFLKVWDMSEYYIYIVFHIGKICSSCLFCICYF